MGKAEPGMVMGESDYQRPDGCPVRWSHHTPHPAFPLLARPPFPRGGSCTRKARFGKEPGVCELLLDRSKEGATVDAIGGFPRSVKKALHVWLAPLSHRLPLLINTLSDVLGERMDGDLSLLGKERR